MNGYSLLCISKQLHEKGVYQSQLSVLLRGISVISTVLIFQHLDPDFRGKMRLASWQKCPNFGAKCPSVQLQKPEIFI